MPDFLWRWLATLLARPAIADWIIKRAQRTPYDHLKVTGPSGQTYIERVPSDAQLHSWESWYMRRWWFLRLGPLQVRVHHILLADIGRDLHDHPWPFRTFILRGGYIEIREGTGSALRLPGRTAAMRRGEFHRIAKVAPSGAWTLFVTWGPRQGWGFKRPTGVVVPHEEYSA